MAANLADFLTKLLPLGPSMLFTWLHYTESFRTVSPTTHSRHFSLKHWICYMYIIMKLLWRNNGVSNHQPHECLLNRSLRCRSKNTSKLRVTGLCAGRGIHRNSPHKWPVTQKMFPFDDVIMKDRSAARFEWCDLTHKSCSKLFGAIECTTPQNSLHI